eukprot:g3178.t1
MRDPVTTADGHSYERKAIEGWFARGNLMSPQTGERLPHTQVTPNIALRHAIHVWSARMAEPGAVAGVAEAPVALRLSDLDASGSHTIPMAQV